MKHDLAKSTIKKEIVKTENFIVSTQQQLDSAKQSKASQSTIVFLEERIEALEQRKKRFNFAISKLEKTDKTGEQTGDKKKAAATSGKKVEGKKDGD